MHHLPISNLEVDLKDYIRIQQISKGSFGKVHKVQNIKTGSYYAAKVIECGDNQESCEKMIDREIGILIYSQHPTIIKFIGYSKLDFLGDHNITLILELAKNGSLLDVLQNVQCNNGPDFYTNTMKQIILIGISRGMKYLHDRNIIHRDLKPGNILLDDNFHPLITDFGLSKIFDFNNSSSQSQPVGTLIYMAPELLEGERYGRKADVYSFGILMYEVVTDEQAYPDLCNKKLNNFNFIRKVLEENYRPVFNYPIKHSIKKLIQKCWSKDPHKRPSFEDIYEYLSSLDDSFLLEDVDVDEVQLYVEDINEVNDGTDHILNRTKKLILENQSMKRRLEQENQSMKRRFEQENQSMIRRLEQENQSIKRRFEQENQLMKRKLEQENQQLKKERESNYKLIQKLEYENQALKRREEKKNEELYQMKLKKETAMERIGAIFEYSGHESDAFKGIIYHLGQVFFGNPCEKREIRVFTSSTHVNFEGKNVTSLDEAHHYFASDAKNSWLVYDFRERKVHPTHYSIRSTNFGNNHGHPQNWVIEGSNSGQVNDWKIIDTRNNVKVLDEPNGRTYHAANRFHTFEIQEKLEDDEFFRFLRIRQTGVSTRGDYIFEFSALEYFGTLLDLYSACEYKRWNFQFRKFP